MNQEWITHEPFTKVINHTAVREAVARQAGSKIVNWDKARVRRRRNAKMVTLCEDLRKWLVGQNPN